MRVGARCGHDGSSFRFRRSLSQSIQPLAPVPRPLHIEPVHSDIIFRVGEAGEGITGRTSGRVRAIRRDAREDILVCPSESRMRGALLRIRTCWRGSRSEKGTRRESVTSTWVPHGLGAFS